MNKRLWAKIARRCRLDVEWHDWACGYEHRDRFDNQGRNALWSPLSNNGDAFELALLLKISIQHDMGCLYVTHPNVKRFNPIVHNMRDEIFPSAVREEICKIAEELTKVPKKTAVI
jgi:hypothetical protein